MFLCSRATGMVLVSLVICLWHLKQNFPVLEVIMLLCSHVIGMVLGFSDKGIVYSARAYKIPECTRNAAGTPLIQVQ
jgi:DNA gyrase/topoisomerase IV subunit A